VPDGGRLWPYRDLPGDARVVVGDAPITNVSERWIVSADETELLVAEQRQVAALICVWQRHGTRLAAA
jgi:hypothetical protein